jgi:hypothetical protein
LYYNVFILENKIDARVFRRTCVNLYYILLEIALICVILESVFLLMYTRPVKGWMRECKQKHAPIFILDD